MALHSPYHSALQVLNTVYGYESFRQQQAEIIEDVIQGNDCFVLMPTGGGKSLCYQIPALIRSGTAIVVSPLIALMQDQVSALKTLGIKAAFYNSSLNSELASAVLQDLHAQKLDLLYVSPERLLNQGFIQRLQSIEISLFAIDEAHCISQWGHDFRPEYSQMGSLREWFNQVPFIALTATADKATREDIIEKLHFHSPKIHISSFDRPNIYYRVEEKNNTFQQLLNFLEGKNNLSGIVYALSRKKVEEVAEKLKEKGFNAKAYHAGLPAEIRETVHQQFIRDEINIVVATVAFGMGIDKPNVRFVVHYDLPKNIEGYYQETGRAGRDGLESDVLMLFGMKDVTTSKYFIDQISNESQKRLENFKLNAMIEFAEAQTCRRNVLLNYFGEITSKPCGNCDICLNPPEWFDGKIVAQKVLSCVYRMNQNYGVKQVVDVLRGLNNEKIRASGHQYLSTYGIGKEYSAQQWNSFIRQLIHLGYLFQDIQNYSVLKLTESSGELLKGKINIQLALPKKAKSSSIVFKKSDNKVEDKHKECFEALRILRRDIAEMEDIPAYQVFGDATLIEMAKKRPKNDSELLQITGVGQAKMARFGFDFLQFFQSYQD